MRFTRVLLLIAVLGSVFMVGCKKDSDPSGSPSVTGTTPTANSTGIARNTSVTFTFSEAMDPATITTSAVTLKQGNTPVPGTVVYTGLTATFTPLSVLLPGTDYSATVNTNAKTAQGHSLSAPMTFDFRTGGTTTSTLAPVDLGSSGDYVIVAKTAINNSSTSALTGDLALSPAATSYVTGLALTNATGYATSAQVVGKVYAADMADPTPIDLTTAVNNMVTAYNDAAGRTSPDFVELGSGDIGSRTLSAGLYKWTTDVIVPSDVTLSGTANDVWIFQISGNLNLSSAVHVALAGGAQAKNIFWQVAGEATFGTTSHIEGVVMSMTGITFQTGSSMTGRALAQTAVVLDANVVTKP